MLKKLPIGISAFSEIINKQYVYIDKTKFVHQLAKGKYYFLSRPRRFGKSLFLDTLKQAFLGRKDLFNGLYLERNWNWNITYPVIHINFTEGEMQSYDELIDKIHTLLKINAESHQITLTYTTVSDKFKELITLLYIKYQQQVVVLIDEYDKPILDNITNINISSQIRTGLRDLYSVIKGCDEYLRFALLTGVSKFSKVSLFSGLNNLQDISLSSDYADICGYTDQELWHNFNEHLPGVDHYELRHWYNGYNFSGSEQQKVYNPFDILLFCANNCQYRNYWFETATPTFLIKLLKDRQYYFPALENLQVGDSTLNTFDVDRIELESLLFQTGYLTVTAVIQDEYTKLLSYKLGYPNFEVRQSLSDSLLDYFTQNVSLISQTKQQLKIAIMNNDFIKLKLALNSFFAAIPYNWYTNNNINSYEGFYASIIYAYVNALGLTVIAEDTTNHGRIDLTLNLPTAIMIMEFKVLTKIDTSPSAGKNTSSNLENSALVQIQENKYYEKYLDLNKPIFLIGIEFNKNTRNIHDLAWCKYQG